MQEITLKITIQEANLIMESLGNMPFNQVFQLIGKIQSQAGQQLQQNGQPEQNEKVSIKNINETDE